MAGEGSRDLEVMLGDPRKAIASMSGPLIVSFLIVQVNSFADTSWCSTLGVDATSAVSTISPFYWIVSGFGTGLGVGAATAMARHLGRGEKSEAEGLLAQSMFVSVVLALVLMAVIWLLVGPSISVMGADDIRTECIDYIVPIVWCSLPLVVNGTVAGTLRAEGAARRSTIMLIVAAVTNIILDPILIIVLDMGLAGAGWATGISALVSTLLGLWWYADGAMYLRMSFKGFRPVWSQIWEVLFVGVPRAAESVVISAMSIIQRIFVMFCGGTAGVMLFNVPWRFVTLAQAVSQAVGSALVPVASAAMGAGDAERAKTANRYSMRLSLAIMIVVAVALFVFADWAVIPFTLSDSMAEYRSEIARVLRIYAVLIPFMAFVDIGSSILQSLRMAQMSLVATFLRNALIVVFLVFASRVSMDAIFWSVVVAEVVGGALMIWLAAREFRKAAANGVAESIRRRGRRPRRSGYRPNADSCSDVCLTRGRPPVGGETCPRRAVATWTSCSATRGRPSRPCRGR